MLRQRLEPFIQINGDYRDIDLVMGWSPKNPNIHAWIAAELSFGDGYLDRGEKHQQYKINGYDAITRGNHTLTFFGLAYYGFFRLPGLFPIDTKVPGDTINPNQSDLTYRTLLELF